jgi:hypothetical protein
MDHIPAVVNRVTLTHVDQVEHGNIKKHGVTRLHDRIYSHKATKKLRVLSNSQEQ